MKKVGMAARAAFEQSLSMGRDRIQQADYDEAWPALERAHVLGQPDGVLHLRSHWWMLRCGFAERDAREVAGQLVRVFLALPSSWLRRYPVGNTGRARASLLRTMPLAPDVAAFLSDRRR